jgi:hypothetical protein
MQDRRRRSNVVLEGIDQSSLNANKVESNIHFLFLHERATETQAH